MMADSHYRHQVIADIQPFRGILLGLFFMGVGMSIDFGLLGRQGVMIAGLVLGLLLIKSAINWVLCRLMGTGRPDATRVSLLLSQSGEFGFVLFGLADLERYVAEDLFQILTLLVALTMVTTPLMANLERISQQGLTRTADRHDVSTNHIDAGQPHVIIAGFGRVGRRVSRILQAGNVPYLAIDSNADRVLDGRRDGFSVFYGDASQVDVLKAAGAGQAGVLVCTLDEAVPAVRLVSILRQHYPGIAIHARGRDWQHCQQLLKAGATIAISESLEASLQIGGAVLNTMGIFEEDAHRADRVVPKGILWIARHRPPLGPAWQGRQLERVAPPPRPYCNVPASSTLALPPKVRTWPIPDYCNAAKHCVDGQRRRQRPGQTVPRTSAAGRRALRSPPNPNRGSHTHTVAAVPASLAR